MSATKTIDVRGLDHAEKEGKIFPGIESLKPGETLKISVEFNPAPLVYMLKARGEHETWFEKEGPEEWVLAVKRKGGEAEKKEQLRQLVSELGQGDVSAETRQKARELFDQVDARTLGLLEQELIREGVPHEAIRSSLCDIHLEAMRDSLVAKRTEVAAPHPIHTLMEEHKVILRDLDDLSRLVKKLEGMSDYESLGEGRQRIKDIAHHLVEAERHHQREEDVIFPALERRDVTEPPSIMRMDHVEFRKRKHGLKELTQRNEVPFADYRAGVAEMGGYLAKELESHIFKEDNILYQIALQVVPAEEWEQIKKDCDRIGYCCFSPKE